MTEYERKAINGCVEPVLTALALGATYEALSMEPRDKEEEEINDRDCPDCHGTGIGYSHEPRSCGHCGGRGYMLPRDEQED